jgi:hypothetical protein
VYSLYVYSLYVYSLKRLDQGLIRESNTRGHPCGWPLV